MSIRHWLSHKLGWNLGEVEAFWRGGQLLVGFRCHTCGGLSNVHDTGQRRESPQPVARTEGAGPATGDTQ